MTLQVMGKVPVRGLTFQLPQQKFNLIEMKLTSRFRFQSRKCVIPFYKDEKAMSFMNFKIVNAKN